MKLLDLILQYLNLNYRLKRISEIKVKDPENECNEIIYFKVSF